MATTVLSKQGKEFLRDKIKGSGNSFLSGKAADKVSGKYALPKCRPPCDYDKLWTSNPEINGGIRTNDEYATALIKWYNNYAEEFELDANIMMAQAVQESGLIVWNYSRSAMGISQFVDLTFYSGILENKRGNFDDTELAALTTDLIGFTYQAGVKISNSLPFLTKNPEGRGNKAQIHQNITDNPEIMIKAQFDQMKWLGSKSGDVASCCLFRYNRGLIISKTTDSYSELIQAAHDYGVRKNKPYDYEKEGIDYVFDIFVILHYDFGYTELRMTKEEAANFDSFNSKLT